MDQSGDYLEEDVVPILVVDDRDENLLAMESILARPGYRIVTARSGNDALKHVLKHDFAVVLLDLLMPGMDGFETAGLIRSREASRHTPIIFLTAAGADLATVERGYAVGAVDYLVKPLNAEMVRAKVGVFVDLYRKARQMRRQEELLRAAERDRSEAAIREREALYEASFNGAAVGIAHVTRNGEWLRANPCFARTIGYDPADLLSMRLENVVHPLDLADDRVALRRLFDGELDTHHREERYLHKDGHTIWVDLTVSPLRDASGTVKNLIVLIEDITSRRDAKRRERLIAGVTQILLQTLDHPADMVRISQLIVGSLGGWCVIGTLDGQDRSAGPPSGPVVAHADPRLAAVGNRLRAALACGAGYAASLASRVPFASVAPAADLEAAWGIERSLLDELEVKGALGLPLIGHDRVLGRITFLSTDALGPGEILMAHEVTQRIALALDNARLHREAAEAVRARDEFLSIASHELRTPLTPLRIHFQRMLDERGQLVSGRPERMQPILQRCERQVRRLETLVENLFDVSRLTTGKMNLHLGEVDLADVVREVVPRFAEELAAAGCPLALDLGTGGALVGRWDRLRLEQVVTNLISNAVKYAAGQPIEITVTPGAAAAPGAERTARLIVRDHGAGIPSGDLERIFQRYHRIAPPSLGGLGLGLFISKQIVDAHGGSISVESSGEGTRFVVDFPLRGAEAAAHIPLPHEQKNDRKIPIGSGPGPGPALVGWNDPGVWS
ncbi:MAG TPA: ATP-binding protein [Polyangia bacterium]